MTNLVFLFVCRKHIVKFIFKVKLFIIIISRVSIHESAHISLSVYLSIYLYKLFDMSQKKETNNLYINFIYFNRFLINSVKYAYKLNVQFISSVVSSSTVLNH